MEELKLSLFIDDMFLSKKNSNQYTNILELINWLRKCASFNTLYKNQLYFYTLTMNNSSQKSKIKCLGTNLTKEIHNLYAENYKVSLKEIKEYRNGDVWLAQSVK